jgi:hypothetical protein
LNNPKLTSEYKKKDFYFLALVPVLPFVFNLLRHKNFAYEPYLVLLLAYFLCLALVFKYGSLPLVWVKKDVLHIRDDFIEIDKIPKATLNGMHYEIDRKNKNSNGVTEPLHRLIIDLKGFELWSLPIKTNELVRNLNLYNFINENFHEIKLVYL